MNAVIYCSFSGQCKAVAEKLGEKIKFPVIDFSNVKCYYENAVIIFPVHCQGLPLPLKQFLKNFDAKYITLIALYGQMSAGNAIYEAYKITGRIIGAVYLPATHTYGGRKIAAPEIPEEVIEKIANPHFIDVPRRIKAPFAGFFPEARSRALIKIINTEKCTKCGICNGVCPMKCMHNGITGKNCIRCMKCVYSCPENALETRQSKILKAYIKRPRMTKTIIYI